MFDLLLWTQSSDKTLFYYHIFDFIAVTPDIYHGALRLLFLLTTTNDCLSSFVRDPKFLQK